MSDDQPLLPCPFCDGKASRFTISDDRDPNHGGDVISCSTCGACSRVVFGEKAGLADAWNSRTFTGSAWLGQAGLYRNRLDAVGNGEQSVTHLSSEELFNHANRYLYVTRTLGLRLKAPNSLVTKTPEETDSATDEHIQRHMESWHV